MYFVINEQIKTKFEKEFQVPFGYYACPRFQTEDAAVWYVENLKSIDRDVTYVEKCSGGNCEIIYSGSWFCKELDRMI